MAGSLGPEMLTSARLPLSGVDLPRMLRPKSVIIKLTHYALQFPGISKAWTMPIKARIDMLSTGIRTSIGVKVYGPDLAGIDRLSREIEADFALDRPFPRRHAGGGRVTTGAAPC
jgi:Cu/Ag efflux pump CusA